MIRFLLLYKIEVTDAHPLLTAAIGVPAIYGLCCALHAWGLL